MKKIAVLSMFLLGLMTGADAATRGRTVNATSNATSSKPVTARAATNSRTAPRAAATSGATGNTVVRGRAATTPTTKPTVAARAATMQKVIGTGTKVASAAKNVVVSEECQAKFDGCMDAFCMLDNETGGRCICSDKNAEFDEILAEIEKLDQQSYKMATVGVERLEMGADADAAMGMAQSVADSIIEEEEKTARNKRRTLDLSLWDTSVDFDVEEDIFGAENDTIEGKEGDALYLAASKLCVAQIPECSAEINMLKTIYGQKIRSDCAAYENSLKQQKNASAQKLAAAEQALRQTALDQYRSANKYDLGQCTVEFKKCMQTTGGCGDDFAGCASIAAMDQTNHRQKNSRTQRPYQIKGAVTTIEISASTYDALISKKPLCESVTKSCVAVADQVWDTFLREVAPQVKSAELIAEDKARQDCIGNISSCFQKACKDTIDPNDPDGSYDMCLSRPETMLNLCKVPLNACGIDASSVDSAQDSQIWDFVVARLAAMRVDACTTEVKECLQSDDRCGEDYSQCIGLDITDLRAMCPLDKLVGCQREIGTDETTGKKSFAARWDYIDSVIQGIWLGIDNSMLEQCQNLVNEKMIEVCGDTATCAAFDTDKTIGTDSLSSYTNNNGDFVIDGLISFGNVQINRITDDEKTRDENVKFGTYEVDIAGYADHVSDTDTVAKSRIISALQSTANKINQKIAIISEDSKIKMCVQGRDMSQIRTREDSNLSTARYPHLLDSAILAIVSSGIEKANKNYTEKYNELVAEALETADDQVKSVLCAAMATSEEPQCANWRPATFAERFFGADSDVQNGMVCTEYASSVFDTIFQEDKNAKVGLSDAGLYATQYVISGAKLADLASVQQSGHSEYVQMDGFGNMLGRIAMSAAYSATNNTCTITTTTTLCEDTQAVITTDTSCQSGAVHLLGGSGCKGGGGILTIGQSKTNITQDYHGTMCEKFAEPETTTQTIKM